MKVVCITIVKIYAEARNRMEGVEWDFTCDNKHR